MSGVKAAKLAELKAAKAANEEQATALQIELDQVGDDIRTTLTTWYGPEVALWLMEPEKARQAPTTNKHRRLATPEQDIASRIEALRHSRGEMGRTLRKMGDAA